MYYRKGITNKVLWKEEKVIALPRETEKSQEVITFKMISEGRIGILEPEEELSSAMLRAVVFKLQHTGLLNPTQLIQ